MAKRDYYKVLDVLAHRDRGRHQEGVSPPGDEAPSGPQSGRPRGRGEVQGGQGGLRGPVRRARSARPTTSSAMRASRPRRAGGGGGSARCVRRHLRRRVRRHLRRRAARPRRRSSAAPICATSSSSTSSRPSSATRSNLDFATLGRVRGAATARARRKARSRRPARPATAPARCACSRASSRCSRPARAARAAARSSATPAATAAARAACASTRRLSVKVPAGVDNGDRIRLAGEGEAGRNGGPPGDLYVEVRVREHAIFERDGAHLSCEVPVSFATAALGGVGRGADARRRRRAQDAGRDAVRARVPAARARASSRCAAARPAICSAASSSRRR